MVRPPCQYFNVNECCWMEVEDAVRELGLAATDKLPRLSHGICPDVSARLKVA